MDVALTLIEIEALKAELEATCDALLSVAQQGLELAAGTPVEGGKIAEIFTEIMTLCAFQDLAGQRLDRLARQVTGKAMDTRPDAALLNGPAISGGLDQSAADALFRIAPAR